VAAAAKEAQRTRVAEAEEARSRAMEQVEFLKAELKAAQEQALEAEAKNNDVSGAVEEAYEEVRTLTAALQEREACVQDIEQRLAAAEAAHDKVQIELRDAQAVAAQATAESNATRYDYCVVDSRDKCNQVGAYRAQFCVLVGMM
jgi:chromosome segregation ATPase